MRASSRQLCVVSGALLVAFLFISYAATSWAWGQVPGDGASGEDAAGATGRLIVTYEEGSGEGAGDGAVGATKVEAKEKIEAVNAEVVSVPGAESETSGATPKGVRRAKEKLEEEPGVQAVEYDHAREASYSPGDPGLSDQWGLNKTRFRSAWDATRGDGVRIAVIDSGIAAGHPDLAGKVVLQRDFVNGDGNADDDLGHGTHVAGIAAARTGNGTGISGGCPGCEILVAKTMQGRIGYDSDVAEGIVWAADNGADVINLSLTGPAPSSILEKAVDYAWNKGAVVVAAAGNTGDGTVQYPAAYPNAVAVAATDRYDNRASFSTVGGWIDVAAPGVGVLSTLPGGYGYMNGTSMATPHVAALAALLANEGLSNERIKNRILSNTTDLGPNGHDPYFGTGRIDAARALNRPSQQPPPPPRPQPAPEPAPEPAPQQPDAPADRGGDNQRTLASDEQQQQEQQQPRETPAPPPEEPEPQLAPAEKAEPPVAEPPAAPVEAPAEPTEPAVQEATPQPPEEPSAPRETPAPQEPPRELVFQDDEELEEKFRQAEIAELASSDQPAQEDECTPVTTSPAGDEQEVGFATAMIDGVLSAMRSVLEGIGLVSAAEAEQEAATLAPCAETAQIRGTS